MLSVNLPGLQLADLAVDRFDGQVIYLDFDGESNVNYRGPVVVDGIDVPAFELPRRFGASEADAAAAIADKLTTLFSDAGVVFTLARPANLSAYSTIYVGGDSSAFASYGSFAGLAERVDVGNVNLTDNAFVFPNAIAPSDIDGYITELSAVIAHEAGHLLGYAHVDPSDPANPLASVAAVPPERTFTHPAENGSGDNVHDITLSVGTYTFEVDAEPNGYHRVDWFTTYSGTGGLKDTAYLYFYDDEDFSFSTPGTYWVRAELYRSDFWNNTYEWEAVYRWRVTVPDTTPPTNPTSFGSTPSTNSWSSDNTVDVNWSGASDNVGLKGYYYAWNTNSTYSVSTGDPFTSSTSGSGSKTSPALSDNPGWYFHIRYQDTSSNLATSTAHYGPFKIDATAPSNPTSFSSSPPAGTWSNDNTVDVSWSGASDNLSGLAGYYYAWSTNSTYGVTTSDSYTSTSSGSGSKTSPSLSDGQWYFHIRYKDNASTLVTSTAHYGPFKIDTVAPSVPVMVSPVNGAITSDTTPTLDWNDSTDGTSGVYRYRVQVDGSIGASTGWLFPDRDVWVSAPTTQWDVTPELAEGGWYWRVMAEDRAGNPGGWSGTRNFQAAARTVDLTARPHSWLELDPWGKTSVTGSIGTTMEQKLYRLVPDTSGKAIFDSDTPGSDLDTLLGVYNSSGQRLAWSNDQGIVSWDPLNPSDSRVEINLTAGQGYYVLVSGASGSTGTFTLNVDAVNAALTTVNLAANIGDGQVNSQSVSPLGDADYFKVVAPANASGSLRVTVDSTNGLNGVVTVWEDTGLFGGLVQRGHDVGVGSADDASVFLASGVTPGTTYYIRAGGNGASTGTYNVVVDFGTIGYAEPPIRQDPLVVVAAHDWLSLDLAGKVSPHGEISSATDQTVYCIRPPRSGTMALDVDTLGSSLDSLLAVYDSTGQRLAWNDDQGILFDALYPTDSRMSLSVRAGRLYLITVSGKRGRTGAFTLNVDAPDPVPSAVALRRDGTGDQIVTRRSIASSGEADYFAVVAPKNTAGSITVTVDSKSDSLSGSVTVWEENLGWPLLNWFKTTEFQGEDQGQGSADDASVIAGATKDYTYYIRVTGARGTTGAYDLRIDFNTDDFGNSTGDARLIIPNVGVSAGIDYAGDRDVVGIAVRGGVTYTLSVEAPGNSRLAGGRLRVLNEYGGVMTSGDFVRGTQNTVEFTPSLDGACYVEFSGNTSRAAGEYVFSVSPSVTDPPDGVWGTMWQQVRDWANQQIEQHEWKPLFFFEASVALGAKVKVPMVGKVDGHLAEAGVLVAVDLADLAGLTMDSVGHYTTVWLQGQISGPGGEIGLLDAIKGRCTKLAWGPLEAGIGVMTLPLTDTNNDGRADGEDDPAFSWELTGQFAGEPPEIVVGGITFSSSSAEVSLTEDLLPLSTHLSVSTLGLNIPILRVDVPTGMLFGPLMDLFQGAVNGEGFLDSVYHAMTSFARPPRDVNVLGLELS